MSDLLHLVKTELSVDKVKGVLCGKLNFTGNNFPIHCICIVFSKIQNTYIFIETLRHDHPSPLASPRLPLDLLNDDCPLCDVVNVYDHLETPKIANN